MWPLLTSHLSLSLYPLHRPKTADSSEDHDHFPVPFQPSFTKRNKDSGVPEFRTFEQVSESEQPNRDLLESVLKLQKVLETLLPPDFSLNLGSGLEVAVHKNFWSRSSRFGEGFQDGTQNFLHALWVHPAADCLVFVIY